MANSQIEDFPTHIDIDLHRMPCDLIDASFMFRKGAPLDLSKHKLYQKIVQNTSTQKNETKTYSDAEKFTQQRSKDEVLKALEENEGCKVVGSVDLHIMSTSLQIRFANPYLTEQLRHHFIMNNRSSEFVQDLSHTINSLTFGNHTEHNPDKM